MHFKSIQLCSLAMCAFTLSGCLLDKALMKNSNSGNSQFSLSKLENSTLPKKEILLSSMAGSGDLNDVAETMEFPPQDLTQLTNQIIPTQSLPVQKQLKPTNTLVSSLIPSQSVSSATAFTEQPASAIEKAVDRDTYRSTTLMSMLEKNRKPNQAPPTLIATPPKKSSFFGSLFHKKQIALRTGHKAYSAHHGLYVSHKNVRVSCLKPRLRRLITKVENHFGSKAVITSGFRSISKNRAIGGARNSMHIHCAAADFYIPGVRKSRLISYVKRLRGRGGLGVYCNKNTIHLDIGKRRTWYSRCRRTRRA